MATSRDYYDILGISKSASAADVKSAYRKAAMKFHPDRNKEAGAESKFKEINEAYEVLSDEQKKAAYDQYGHAAFQQGGMGGAQGGNPFAGGGPFSYSYTNSGGGGNPFDGFDLGGDPFDIFESFFGGGRRGPRKPVYQLNIAFMEAVKGVSKEVDINGKRRTIKIPAGADTGTRIRFDEFDIVVGVGGDDRFKREGDDLYVDINVPFWRAALGGEMIVPTVDGTISLKVRAGTQPNTMVRLREYGVSHVSGRGKGDLYVRIVITIPEKLTKQEREALESFQK